MLFVGERCLGVHSVPRRLRLMVVGSHGVGRFRLCLVFWGLVGGFPGRAFHCLGSCSGLAGFLCYLECLFDVGGSVVFLLPRHFVVQVLLRI